MPIRSTPPTASKRVYPHVSEVQDWQTQQTIRLLWDRIFDLQEKLTAHDTTLQQLVDGHNANETTIASVTRDAQQALALSQQAGQAASSLPGGGGTGGSGGGTGGGGGGGGSDGGQGNVGCAAAGATGHDTGGLLNAVRAGQIVCGTGNEFSALKNATATIDLRKANNVEMVRRMIWHLRLAGFTAGRQKNPSGALSDNKLTVVVDNVLRAYDVLGGSANYTAPMTTQMNEVTPATLVDDAGIPD